MRPSTTFALLRTAGALQLLPRLLPLSDSAAIASTHFFSSTANWLVPGHVLCGRYPGSCPSRPVGVDVARERMAQLRGKGGVSTFVCLQDELPAQDSAWPPEGIVGPQSNNAVSLQTEPFLPYRHDAGADARFVHFPIVDLSVAPSLERLDALVFDLASRVHGGEVCYIHCWGGRGRTGLVAACLLGALYREVGAEESLERVQAYCRLREPESRCLSPETEEQKRQVREWYEWVKGGSVRVARPRGG